MFSAAEVRALLHDQRLAPPVASLYLNTDRGHPDGEKYLASFRHLVHEADRHLAKVKDAPAALARARLTEAVPDLLKFLDEEVAPKLVVRGAALFVSLAPTADHDPRTPAFTAFTLPRPVRNQAHVDRRPHIRPLLFLLDQYERVGVIVADRNHARILTLFLGEIEHLARRRSDVPRRHDQGGWSQMLFQRDIDGHIKAHIRATVRAAVNLFGRAPLKRIVLGGSDETLALLKRALPHRFREMVVGAFPAEPHAPDAAIVSRALALAQAAEGAEEAARVEALSDALARRPRPAGYVHRGAVHGTAETLRALSEARVRLLLLRRGFRLAGSVCDNCGSLFNITDGPCPTCQHPLRAVPDVLEHAVERAGSERAEVEFVTESPTLEALGGVGALLRF